MSVEIRSSGVLWIPRLSKTACFASGVSAAEITVVIAFTFTGASSSSGMSLIRTRFGNTSPVAVSVPPMAVILPPRMGAAAISHFPSPPVCAAIPVGPFSPLSSTCAPETGPSTTLPSRALTTEIATVSLSVAEPSLTVIVML